MFSFISPRRVAIGDAAAFVGTTPRAIRHYHQLGLLPEPERGTDDRRRYGYEEMIRLLWVRRMADAGIALDDIRDATADAGPAAVDGDTAMAEILERLDDSLRAREADIARQRAAVQRMRALGSRMGLLSDIVADRLLGLPEGGLRPEDLDTLLVTERILGPLGAAFQASRFIALATHPALREASDRVDAAEEALDDSVAVDDPRVERVAAERCAFEESLNAVIVFSGIEEDEDAIVEVWEAAHPTGADAPSEAGTGRRDGSLSTMQALAKMPYDFSPARVRCMELAVQMAVETTS